MQNKKEKKKCRALFSCISETVGKLWPGRNRFKTLSKQDLWKLSLEIDVFISSLYQPSLPRTDCGDMNMNLSTLKRQH